VLPCEDGDAGAPTVRWLPRLPRTPAATAWKIAAQVGDTVAKGQVSMILESMQTVVVVDP
jgi:hypothetical protein